MAEQLSVEIRETRGKRNAKRMRKAGGIPGVLYGHGKENICLTIPAHDLDTMVKHGSRMVNLTGAVNESAFIREVQWDTWGTHVVHVDFTRISAHEVVQVQVAVELRGEAPGAKEGGVVDHAIHEVTLDCPAIAIPDKLEANINELQLHGSIKLAELKLPEGASIVGDPAATVVQCVEPVAELEEEVAEAVPGEPEVIGAKEETEES